MKSALEPAPERTTRTTWRECLAAHGGRARRRRLLHGRGLDATRPDPLPRAGPEAPGQPPRADRGHQRRARRAVGHPAHAERPRCRGRMPATHPGPPPRPRPALPAGRARHAPPADVTPIRRPARAPNLNAYTERFVRTIKDSCLERMVLIGEGSRRRAGREFVAHDHHERNHQGLDHRLSLPLSTAPPPRKVRLIGRPLMRPPGGRN